MTVSPDDQNVLQAMAGIAVIEPSVTDLLIALSKVMAIFVSRATFVEPLLGDVKMTFGAAGPTTLIVVNENECAFEMLTPALLVAESFTVMLYFVSWSRTLPGFQVTVEEVESHL